SSYWASWSPRAVRMSGRRPRAMAGSREAVSPPELIDEFCDALWLEDGLARNTLDSYRRDLAQFAAWLERRGRELPAAGNADIHAYLGHQFEKKARASSAARLLSSLKRFYRWCLRQGRVNADPTLDVDSPKLPRALPKALTEADVESLLGAPE